MEGMSLRTVHENPWFRVTLREEADGSEWFRVARPDSAMLIARVADGRLVMVYGTRDTMTGGPFYEFPAGAIDAGEEPIVAAAREGLEETGHRVTDLEKLGSYVEMAGMSGAQCHVFAARSVEVVEQALETGEDWTPCLVTDAELAELVRTGRVRDAGTLSGWSLLRAHTGA